MAVGELVDVECRVRELRPHRKGHTFEAVSTILAQDGEIIATDVSTYLAKGTSSSGSSSSSSPSSAVGSPAGASDQRSDRRDFAPPRPTARWSLPADTGRRYAEVSGDVNPIHMSGLSAKAFGLSLIHI